MAKVKFKDIAKELHVSPSTISLVVHNKEGVNEQTRQRVLEAIRKNGLGHLISKEEGTKTTISLVLFRNGKDIITDSPFFLELVGGIEEMVEEANYRMVISYISEGFEEKKEIEKLKQGQFDGLVLLATEMTIDQIQVILDMGIPTVVLDQNLETENIYNVSINNASATRTATEYLISVGHQKIGYLKSRSVIRNFEERFEGYRKTMENADLKIPENGVIELTCDISASCTELKEILRKDGLSCTAFLADNDLLMLGAAKAFREFQIRIPDRVSLVGFDDLPLTQQHTPTLTTIDVPKRRMGRTAVALLRTMLENPNEAPVRVGIESELVKRRSVAAPQKI